MNIKIKLVGRKYKISIFDSNGKLLHKDYCSPCDLEQMIDDITAEFSEVII